MQNNPAWDGVRASILAAELHLGDALHATARSLHSPADAIEVIARLELALRPAPPAADDPPVHRREVTRLLSDLRGARADLLVHELARQRSAMGQVTESLARLRSARTVDDLADAIPVHTAALGYERAMFSWVQKEYWIPRSMHTANGPDEARATLAAGAPPYTHVRDVVEVHVVRDRRPILVLDCESNPRVNAKLRAVTKSDTYVAAPVVARNHVAGLVHLDRNLNSGLTDAFDRDLLGLFCEGVGVLLDRLLSSELPAVTDGSTEHVAGWVDALTSRELEVLRLLADGLTNAEISQRLFISPDTTKTHVKRLMRKLGTHTRAEAGAVFHRLG